MSSIASGTTTTTALVQTADTTGNLLLQTGSTPTTAVTIDTNQNVGVGVTPSAWGSGIWNAFDIGAGALVGGKGSATNGTVVWYNGFYNGTNTVYKYNGSFASLELGSAGFIWKLAGSGTAGGTVTSTQAMTLDNSGNLLVGTTTDPNTGKSGVIASNGIFGHAGLGGAWVSNAINFNWTGNLQAWVDTTNLGTIAFTSDYRLKENVVAQPNPALTRVMQLQPVQFNRKTIEIYQGSNQVEEGFIADQLQAIIPSAVDGVKDGLTSDGKIQPQTINILPIVSVLTKAIQELSAKVTALEAKLGA